jgi:hypothetical protein
MDRVDEDIISNVQILPLNLSDAILHTIPAATLARTDGSPAVHEVDWMSASALCVRVHESELRKMSPVLILS